MIDPEVAQAIHEAHTTMTYSLRDIANGDTGTLDPRDCPVCTPPAPGEPGGGDAVDVDWYVAVEGERDEAQRRLDGVATTARRYKRERDAARAEAAGLRERLAAVEALLKRHEPCRDGSICCGPGGCLCPGTIHTNDLRAVLDGTP